MKKLSAVLLALLVLLVSLCSCGASADKNAAYTDNSFEYGYGFDEAYGEEPEYKSENAAKADYQAIEDASSRKIIRDASVTVETEKYEDFSSALEKEIASVGGYVESSQEYGNNYNYSSYRRCELVIRVPAEKLDDFLSQMSSISSVTSKSLSTREVTGDYIDTQSEITALETERDALLAILAKADTVEDLITVQERLSRVNSSLQSYKNKLKTYDELIAYSKVNMSVNEVARASSKETKKSFGSEVISRLLDNLYNIGMGFRNFAVWFISSLPYILIFAVIIVVVILIIKKAAKRRKKKNEIKEN